MQAGDKVVYGEIELQVRRELGVGARREVGRTRRECGDKFGGGLNEHAKLSCINPQNQGNRIE